MKRNGHKNGVQIYKCWQCGRQFLGGERLDDALLWEEYVTMRQTYSQLAERHGCSAKTIQRRIDRYRTVAAVHSPRRVVVVMDTTYWGRDFGVMLFKDALTGEDLLWFFVKTETVAMYVKGVNTLLSMGYEIVGIVCDGRRGLVKAFGGIPVQICQFHQQKTVRKHLTSKPKSVAARELKKLSDMLAKTDKESFVGAFEEWHDKWKGYLNERTEADGTGKTHYTHKPLRSAYLSIRRNLPNLFTWYDLMGSGIPNTTNVIDAHFSQLKSRLLCHNGLSRRRKQKFVDEFFKACTPQPNGKENGPSL